MSILVMSQVWKHGPADRSDLLVLLALADFADDDGYCWPSVRTLAEKARLGERGLQKVLRRLEDQKLIEVVTGKGRHGCNEYWILLDAMQQIRMPVDAVEQNGNGEETPNPVHPLNPVHPEQANRNPEPASRKPERWFTRTVKNHQETPILSLERARRACLWKISLSRNWVGSWNTAPA